MSALAQITFAPLPTRAMSDEALIYEEEGEKANAPT